MTLQYVLGFTHMYVLTVQYWVLKVQSWKVLEYRGTAITRQLFCCYVRLVLRIARGTNHDDAVFVK